MILSKHALLVAALFITTSTAFAHSYKARDIAIGHVWALPATGSETRVFFPLVNRGNTEDELVAARTSVASQIELRQNNRYDDPALATFRIEPGKPVPMRPGARHLRLLGLSRTLATGDTFPLILDFRDAGEVTVDVMVEPGSGH